MKPYVRWLLVVLFIGPGGCASHPPATRDPLTGTWVFDRAATRAEIQNTTGYPDEWMNHVMKAYALSAFTFSNGRYTMEVSGKKVTGRYSVKKLSANTYRMTMTCSEREDGDAGVLVLRGESFSFESDTPLLNGAREVYRRKIKAD